MATIFKFILLHENWCILLKFHRFFPNVSIDLISSLVQIMSWCRSGPVFCLLLGVSSDYAQPITGQVTEVTCPVIGRAQPELTRARDRKRTLARNHYLKQWRPSLLRYICVTRFRWVNMREARKLYFYGAVISWFAYISAKNWWIWISLGTHILNISMKLIHCLYAGSSKLNASSSLVYC